MVKEPVVFPNPTNDVLSICLPEIQNTGSTQILQCHDEAGNLVGSRGVTSGNELYTINLSGFNSGLYVVSLLKDRVVVWKKEVVKQ